MDELKNNLIIICALVAMYMYTIILIKLPIETTTLTIIVLMFFKIFTQENK